jgi:hypothetical protein
VNALDVVIAIVAALVLLTFVWSMRSARDAPPPLRRSRGLNRRSNERDRL